MQSVHIYAGFRRVTQYEESALNEVAAKLLTPDFDRISRTLELIFVFLGGVLLMGSTRREAEHRQDLPNTQKLAGSPMGEMWGPRSL
jgi:hypothetical protein